MEAKPTRVALLSEAAGPPDGISCRSCDHI